MVIFIENKFGKILTDFTLSSLDWKGSKSEDPGYLIG